MACLCDFGLSRIVAEFVDPTFLTTTLGGAVRWADARLYRLDTENGQGPVTGDMESDVYSFGSVMLEASQTLHPSSDRSFQSFIHRFCRAGYLIIISEQMHRLS